ncbi:uncharacterized protein [Manis javanica]|uniref:uncharacterized protein n=1 Tax=Manis javanica TaxID=9974 RepID=UPI003C6D1C4C
MALACAFLQVRERWRHRHRPPASDRLIALGGLPSQQSPLLASPAAGGGRQSPWPKRSWWWKSTRTLGPGGGHRRSGQSSSATSSRRRRAARPRTPTPPRACLRPRRPLRAAAQRVGQPVPRRPHHQGRRELGREAAPAAADRWRVQSGTHFRDEGDSDRPAGWKDVCWEQSKLVSHRSPGPREACRGNTILSSSPFLVLTWNVASHDKNCCAVKGVTSQT